GLPSRGRRSTRRDAPLSTKARNWLRTFWKSRRRTYVLLMGYSACPALISASMFSQWRRRRAILRNCRQAWSRGSTRRITAYRQLRPSPTAATSPRSRSEERRVGKEGKFGWGEDAYKKDEGDDHNATEQGWEESGEVQV